MKISAFLFGIMNKKLYLCKKIMKEILNWYFNTKKFTYGSRVSKYNDYYIISVGFDKYYFGERFNEVIIKTTTNKLLKFLFKFVKFEDDSRYFRNIFSGNNCKKNWKKVHGNSHLAWEKCEGFNREHRHITKVK